MAAVLSGPLSVDFGHNKLHYIPKHRTQQFREKTWYSFFVGAHSILVKRIIKYKSGHRTFQMDHIFTGGVY